MLQLQNISRVSKVSYVCPPEFGGGRGTGDISEWSTMW